MDPEKAVRNEGLRIASALKGAAERVRNEVALWDLTAQELADIKRSLEELSQFAEFRLVVRPTRIIQKPRVLVHPKGVWLMHVLLTTFVLGPGSKEIADKMGQQFGAMLRSMKGFESMTMFSDHESGEYGGLSLWATKEDAEAALAGTAEPMKQPVGDLLKGPPVRKVYELWEASKS